MFRIVFWDVLPCKRIVDRRFRGAYCLHHQQVVNSFTRQYIPEDNSEHHTRRRENLKSHIMKIIYTINEETFNAASSSEMEAEDDSFVGYSAV
jgi:hypothetical protein